jgi:DDE superfamily endonuclease
MVEARHPVLNDVWCTMDGLKLKIQSAPERAVQNLFYNGWQHDTFITNVFVFCLDGTIPICTYNFPGCVHDSAVAEYGKVYDKLDWINISKGVVLLQIVHLVHVIIRLLLKVVLHLMTTQQHMD